ncbi:protein LURP-one-related 4-like [Salvia miltiorrhiza]|uniref:protein LURP-one-related 4-like n=1 Tax=Salvia miltiorrhiza TaxID=226208 RepID=UPI0025ABABA4|nr:protein LURP-one-related 4-like [Salvia miltiorrhiza]XP_057796483.1 protein LURP-one-related 4-like [Salvia miltiorrhiza]
MARVHPNPSANTCSSSSSSSEKETFTIWMKSLVCHGNGCTVFNSDGDVVFRVDNYQQRCSSKAFLMDSAGNILFSLNRKKLGLFGDWEGFKWIDSVVRMEKPCFRVRRNHAILRKDNSCVVSVGCDENSYTITGFEGKSTLRITDFSGQILAEATQKLSAEGVALGDDVLRLTVEARADQSLVMALVTVYGLINRKL